VTNAGSISEVIAGRAAFALTFRDCLDRGFGLPAMRDKVFDHLIADPPYSQHVHASQRAGVGRPADGWRGEPIARERDLGFAHLAPVDIPVLAREFARVTRRWVLVFSDIESCHLWREALEATGLEYVRTGLWRKVNGAPQFTGDRPAVGAEAITICHPPGRKEWNGGGKHGVWDAEALPVAPTWYDSPIVIERGAGEHRVHPTQKPEKLMRELVSDFTDPGDLIADPFAGSATTGAVALPLGRRFIGWELQLEHVTTAVARLSGADYKPPAKAPAVEAQASLFGGG
jgi:site-specific DNA-methyltransferase (adenine-specific)